MAGYFENGLVNGYTYYTRYIASWTKVNTKLGEKTYFGEPFKDWLRHLGLSDTEVNDITNLAECGKLELETDAKEWIKKQTWWILEK